MENESSVIRLRRKLSELSREYSKEKQTQTRSKSANGRCLSLDPNCEINPSSSRRIRRKIDEYATEKNYIQKDMIPTRDNDNENMTEKKTLLSDEQNLVTGELIQVLNSKQTRIDQLEQRLKQVEYQESQWKMKYERECNRCELLKARVGQLEQELLNRKYQSKILGQLQTDVQRLHSAFDALEVENTQLNAQLSLTKNTSLSSQLDKFRHDLAQTCHESLC